MTNAIGVAKTIITNRPIASDAPQAPSQATLGFVPLPPPRQYRCNTPHSPVLPLPGVYRVRALGTGKYSLDDDDDDDDDK